MARALGDAVLELLAPVLDAVERPSGLGVLLEELGISVEVDDALRQEFENLMPVAAAIDELADAIASKDLARIASATPAATDSVFTAISALDGRTAGELAAWPEPLNEPDTWTELARRLPEYLLTRFLAEAYPIVFSGLDLFGIVKRTWHDFERAPEVAVDWDALGALATDPTGHLADFYGWDGAFETGELLERLTGLGRAAGLEARLQGIHPRLADTWWPHGIPPRLMQVQVSLLDASTGPGALSLLVVPIPDEMGFPSGVLITTEAAGEVAASIDLGDGWSFYANGAIDATGAIGLKAAFDGVALESDAAEIGATIGLLGEPDEPWPLLGSDSMRLELGSVEMEVRLQGDTDNPELVFEVSTGDQLRVVFDPGEGDSFIADVLGAPLTVESELSASWSSTSGLALHGGVGLDVTIAIGKSLGPIFIDWLRIVAALGASGADVELTVTGGLDIGPFAAVVENVGLRAGVAPAEDGSGNLGALDGSLAFRAPDGLGLAVDVAGVVSGGGYLYIDADAGAYAGMAELDMLGVGITATGLIATELPGDVQGWSMYLSLAARFTGVQLGFGFTLNGVGGLVGIHRGLDDDALGDGVRSGALDGILFPDDAIAEAPQILAEIETIFPVAIDQHVFGPIAQIGWGTPTLIELEIGVVVQLPDPLTVSLLGSLAAVLPTEEAAIVELRVDVAGTLNLTEGTLKVDASLRDSRVLTLELTGDMAIRASFLDNPSFLISFGGFHPDFSPPDDFPAMQRLGVALDAGDALRLQLGGYFALTSNTVQFGAEFWLYASAVGIVAEGGASFDALIQFKPFGFVIALEVWVSIRAGKVELLGVLLAGKLSGPNPWHVIGKATFKVLGVKASLEIEQSIGGKSPEAPKEIVDVAELLIEELGIDSAWAALPPAGDGDSGVVVADQEEGAQEVHPAGRIEVRQRVVPLDTKIDHYGNANLGSANTFTLASPKLGSVSIEDPESVEDHFAAAQFFELDEDEKLSSPSFEEMPAGLRMGDDAVEGGPEVDLTYDHEVVYRDPSVRAASREKTGEVRPGSRLALERALVSSAAIAQRTVARLPRSTSPPGDFSVNKTTFVTATEATAEVDLVAAEGVSYFGARTAMKSADDSIARTVIPAYELELL